ncbi:M-phase inducer phosphatase-like [Oppia nitens]|uniref:M-phase inducer phosphatase-like n=1 Tax=Oppia nitens TaxID=1686743 RepID=UPI0023DCDA0D|nr:M-phase inducer phosphatase-like [Oppia nitens]
MDPMDKSVTPMTNHLPVKRRKLSNKLSQHKRTPLFRYYSANDAVQSAAVMTAVQKSCSDPSLIGDFSKSYALPLVRGKHQDLKSISAAVLAQLLEDNYSDAIAEYTVIDCRYPYEYNGGHIRGAKNVFTKEAILEDYINNKTQKPSEPQEKENTRDDNKRQILIFHCEFSSERGPTLSRFLRNNDRWVNKDVYPRLHHPEVYLLEGGYKAFFEMYPNLCEPSSYLPMHSKDHENELKHFRQSMKSLTSDGKNNDNNNNSVSNGFGSVLKSINFNKSFEV